MKDYEITLGYVPVRRDMLPLPDAEKSRDAIRARVEVILSRQVEVKLVTIDDIVPGRMLYSNNNVSIIEKNFQEKEIGALFFSLQLRSGRAGGATCQTHGRSGLTEGTARLSACG